MFDSVRIEYFVSGNTVFEASVLLQSEPGSVAISKSCLDLLILKNYISKSECNFTMQSMKVDSPNTSFIAKVPKNLDFHVFGTKNIFELENLIHILNTQKQKLDPSLFDFVELQKSLYNDTVSSYLTLSEIIPFVDQSLGKCLVMDKNIQNSEEFNQIRDITVVFMRFNSIDAGSLKERNNAEIIQYMAKSMFEIVRENVGCVKQLNYDDKLMTALLVWGLKGYSQEKGDAPTAVQAALTLRKKILRTPLKSQFSIGIATGTVYVYMNNIISLIV